MGVETKIQWTDHTFNPWWGCVEVSPACDHCYARTFAKRVGQGVWGKDAPRRFFGEKHWNEPRKWNRGAEKARERRRVFCASMADVYETREDLNPWRERLWALIDETPWLDWLLLTKRPSNITRYSPLWMYARRNIWFGTTVEDRVHGLPRINALRSVRHDGIKFLSIEPLIEDLGDVDLSGIHWVIVGGESGGGARPFDVEWAWKLIRQSRTASAAPFVKQLGAVPLVPACRQTHFDYRHGGGFTEHDDKHWRMRLRDSKGGDWSEWPEGLRVREFPRAR